MLVLPPPIRILGQSAVAVPLTGTVNETVIVSVPIPAGCMGPNSRLRASILWSYTNSANNKTLRVRLGGAAGTVHHSLTMTTTVAYRLQMEIANVNSMASQKGAPTMTGGWGTSTGAIATGAIDMTVDQTLAIIGTLASAGETITVESYLVELIGGLF
jgi:hypothetical protein